MIQRRDIIRGALGVTAGLVTSGCGATAKASGRGAAVPGSTADGSPAVDVAVRLTVSPAADATNVSPNEPVVVTASSGKLQSVTVAAGGKTVAGTLDPSGLTWRSIGPLGYDQTYTVTASALDGTGAPVEKTCTFATVKPSAVAAVTFQANALAVLKTGGTYGIGQPVIVAFSKKVGDRAAVEKSIAIQTSPTVEGKFYWVDDKTVHWRPARYWAKGTTIAVSANVLGVDLGGGVYGASNSSTRFTIGRALVAVSDNNTHRTQVFVDGQLVRDMACSNGRGGTTKRSDGSEMHFWTQNGPHVVLAREQTVSMSSASNGLTDKSNPNYYGPQDVQWCTRISYSGEFLHAAPWNHSLGKANLSHGCVNLSLTDAQWVFDNFIVGDIVEVKNSPRSLPLRDNGDWTVPYESYGT